MYVCILFIHLYTAKYFQVLPFDTNNSILHRVKHSLELHTKFYLHTGKWFQVLLVNAKNSI